MRDFLRFFDEMVKRFPMHLDISYSKTCDWTIEIYKKGCASDYPEADSDSNDNVYIVSVQDCDMELCFARAHVELKQWLLRFNNGY